MHIKYRLSSSNHFRILEDVDSVTSSISARVTSWYIKGPQLAINNSKCLTTPQYPLYFLFQL